MTAPLPPEPVMAMDNLAGCAVLDSLNMRKLRSEWKKGGGMIAQPGPGP